MADVKIKVKQSVKLKGPLFTNQQSYNIGMAMLLSSRKRIQSAKGDHDEPLPKLSRGYAIYKSKKVGGRAIRDSVLTGTTLGNFSLRKADDKGTTASLTARVPRMRMLAQQKRMESKGYSIWGLSGQNLKDSYDKASEEFQQSMKRMVVIHRA